MPAPRVLVTRALEDGCRTAERLAAMGFEPLLAPLIETSAIEADAPAGPFDAVLLTSAKAAPFLGPFAALPVLAVGERTARAARAAGAQDVRTAGGDAAALVALVRDTLPEGARLLRLAGENRKPEPDASLVAGGYELVTHAVYRARALSLADDVRAALAAGRVDGVLHYSRRAAELFVAALGEAGLADRLDDALHGALSQDAAEPLRKAGARHVVAPETPQEDALLRVFADAASSAFGARWPDVR